MIASNVAYIALDGKHVLRVQRYRNRRDKLKIADVVIDADGNISHPPIKNLDCFASPIEFTRGLSDKRDTYKGKEGPPRWCDGCPSRVACGKFAEHRVESDAEILAKRAAWEDATQALAGVARYEHRTFTEFATACNERAWVSDNADALSSARAAEAKRKRQDRDAKTRKAKRAKTVAASSLTAFDDERERRHAALVKAVATPGAPTWLRNLPSGTVTLTCDVWQVLTAIEHRHGGEVTGGDVTRAMIALGRDQGKPETSLRVRVNEAITRIGKLEIEPDGAPVWGDFGRDVDTNPPRSIGRFLNGVISEVFEEA
ncbi:hypothetical protein [Sphingomonas sp. Leaf412]|uniref:hypothetical protein n=1 Tax=Sphingomonas sp. Leaf412 TaxID=1736370 RepID=UPI000A6B2E9F|nr:hypothetical protein [Sphingomonas sp. Leaf412]